MKIPFLPYCIVPLKVIDKSRDQLKSTAKQLAIFLEQNYRLVEHVRKLPTKYWPKGWSKNDIQNRTG